MPKQTPLKMGFLAQTSKIKGQQNGLRVGSIKREDEIEKNTWI